MPYAQLDDRYDDHRKVKRAWRRCPAAVGLHAMAITYCNRHKSDGDLEADWVDEKLALLKPRDRREALDVLLDVGLFERRGEDFYVHDFLQWNRSRKQREALAEQGRRGGQAKASARTSEPDTDGSGPGSSRGSSDGYTDGSGDGSSTPRHAYATPTPRQNTSSSDADGADVKSTAEDRKNCALLRQFATDRNAKFKVKSRSRWLTDMRLLRERDGNTAAEIEQAIRWVFRHNFWGGVIQSPGNLREHFPTIWGQMGHGNVVPLKGDGMSEIDRKRLESATRLQGRLA